MQDMLEELYAEIKNEDLAEVKKELDQNMEQIHQERFRTILQEVGISNKAIELALESIED